MLSSRPTLPALLLAVGVAVGSAPACTSATAPRDASPDAAPDAPSEPPLYATTAREQGYDSEMRLWEVDRTPNTSVLRATPHRDGSAIGLGMVLMASAADVGRARGFEYFVVLDGLHPHSRPGQGENMDTILGFGHVPDLDIAREFPEHYDATRTYKVRPTDRARLFGGEHVSATIEPPPAAPGD